MSTPKSNKLFGTDGIRGTSNQYPMTPEVVVKIGQAIGYLIRKKIISSPKLIFVATMSPLLFSGLFFISRSMLY